VRKLSTKKYNNIKLVVLCIKIFNSIYLGEYMKFNNKEDYLKFLEESTTRDLLNSLTLNHTQLKNLHF
jgi:hypothetical protein